MQLSLKSVIAAAVLAVASTGAMAQVVTVPGTISDQIPNADTDNGGLIFTLFSVNSDTPWSYSYNLGLRMNDVLEATSDMENDGKSLTWVLPSLNEVGAIADLRWHVTAADVGGSAVANSARYLTTANTLTPTSNNGLVINAAANSFQFVSALNAVAGTPDVSTDPSDPRFAPVNYGVGSNIFASFQTAGSVSDALAFFLMTNPARGTSGQASIDRYESALGSVGRWTLNLDNNTLSWNVAPVPLPAAAWLLLSGLIGMGAVARRRREG